jgi:tryptophan 2,3-dioxygenase
MPSSLQYSDYLQLSKILQAQELISTSKTGLAHDEMLFIIIHQTYELWFKQLLFEVNSVNQIMQKPALNDNSPELQTVVHRLGRCTTILKLLVHQIDVMETMTPMDFLDFRDLLRPASGFQSWQFKELEARLGLKYNDRHGQEYYISQLTPDKIDLVRNAESESSLRELVKLWLERMPFFDEPGNWKTFASEAIQDEPETSQAPIFWIDYRQRYAESLAEPESENLQRFDNLFIGSIPDVQAQKEENALGVSLSIAARRAALFIMLYRGYPILQLPFQLLTQLLEIDEQLSTWRYRHMSMVHRMIGTRIGTGGSSGKDYLKAALDKHYIFKELAQLTSFLIERRRLPKLSREMEKRLGFVG